MAFRVGQKVVCVQNYSLIEPGEVRPTIGEVYTVREIAQAPEGVGMCVAEIVNPPVFCTMGIRERLFPVWWFRPVVERKTDISALTALLNPANHKQLEGV